MTERKKMDSLNLTAPVSEHYQKFFLRFNDINTLPVAEWNSTHLIAYICKKYEEHYGIKYSFKFNHPAPSRSYEIYQIKKIANMLTANPVNLKDYIDWVFKEKVVQKKRRLTSLGLFSHQEIINEYKFKFLVTNKVRRSDQLPDAVQELCLRHEYPITTYAELAFLKKAGAPALLEELTLSGFNIEILDKIA